MTKSYLKCQKTVRAQLSVMKTLMADFLPLYCFLSYFWKYILKEACKSMGWKYGGYFWKLYTFFDERLKTGNNLFQSWHTHDCDMDKSCFVIWIVLLRSNLKNDARNCYISEHMCSILLREPRYPWTYMLALSI